MNVEDEYLQDKAMAERKDYINEKAWQLVEQAHRISKRTAPKRTKRRKK